MKREPTEFEKLVESLGLEFRLSKDERQEIEDQRKRINSNPELFEPLEIEENHLSLLLTEKVQQRWK